MNEQKRKIFEATLTEAFDHDRYVQFLRELLDNMQLVAPNREVKPWNTFSAAVDHYRHIGNYIGEDNNKVALFSVCLKNDKNLENARSMQRAFVKTLLESSDCAGALVAFYTSGELDKWRLSLVRMDYEFSKGKLSEKLTPAKRFSYLVGKGEPCHTAQERLYPIFVEDNADPSLDELEEAFSVEAVTKDFFDQYREKYLVLKEYLDQTPEFTAEAESRGFDSEQFAKKLMGQIVFLYFIQKKGWLGVNAFPFKLTERQYKDGFYKTGRKPKELMPYVYKLAKDGNYYRDNKALLSLSPEDETVLSTLVKGDAWGSGPKNFMRQIFDACEKAGRNYFDDCLEPLFYTGLNQNRGENAFFPPLHRRIPFLNGGLFEEMEGYDWKNNDFSIPNSLFSNADEKGKRDADGILDVFDRYNFTMAEDEPMEREVAIDPEMLGKVFENLLDVTDRKSKGAFYTPREIVHYMCQESLINYLSGRTGIPEEDIRKFVLYGEYFRDEDTRKTIFVKGENGSKGHMEFDKEKAFEIPETIFSYKKNVNRLQEIDNYLANVKVADPAVGSGAFPLGMLNEIVKARETITSYMTIDMNGYQRLSYRSLRNSYRLKRETIKNSIFACDLEASATDITKLRLWLSLVIDNQIMDQQNEELGYSTKPRELPNLDCNIICGNSLVDSFKGISLITENSVLGNESVNRQGSMFDQNLGLLINDLIELQSKLYEEKDHVAKEALKGRIQDIYNQVVLEQIQINSTLVDEYYRTLQSPSQPFILWQLYFPKVFRDNGGFDIVIGNPPYIQLQKTINESTGEKLGDSLSKLGYETFAKTGDIYCLFYEKGYRLLRKNGVLAFITSNKWMRAGYGEKLRGFFAKHTNPVRLIDFGSQKVFESATVDVNILIFTKGNNAGNTMACTVKENCTSNLSVYIDQHETNIAFTTPKSWVILSPIEQNIRSKIISKGTPLSKWDIHINYGIKTGLNDAFIISTKKKDELLAADPKSAELIRPILRGRDIKRYEYIFADLWLIATFPSRKYDIDEYPAVKKHLLSFGLERLEQTGKTHVINGLKVKARKKTNNKWFETQDSINYWNDFFEQKIVWGNLCLSSQFSLVEDDYFINAPSPMIVPGSKYLLAILNSKVADWYIRQLGVTRNGGYFEYKPMFVEQLPVPIIDEYQQKPFDEIVDKIHQLKKQGDDTAILEEEIDNMVFQLYDFTSDEIDLIRSASL